MDSYHKAIIGIHFLNMSCLVWWSSSAPQLYNLINYVGVWQIIIKKPHLFPTWAKISGENFVYIQWVIFLDIVCTFGYCIYSVMCKHHSTNWLVGTTYRTYMRWILIDETGSLSFVRLIWVLWLNNNREFLQPSILYHFAW